MPSFTKMAHEFLNNLVDVNIYARKVEIIVKISFTKTRYRLWTVMWFRADYMAKPI